MAQAALANTMGLTWEESVRLAAAEIPFAPYPGKLETLVGSTYQFSPDWGKLEAGLRGAEGAVRTAKSGHYPKLALTGELHKWWNDYDAGLATDDNKTSWSVGAGVEIPIFDGFLTTNRVGEASAPGESAEGGEIPS
jgi:outer membrane protein TolC